MHHKQSTDYNTCILNKSPSIQPSTESTSAIKLKYHLWLSTLKSLPATKYVNSNPFVPWLLTWWGNRRSEQWDSLLCSQTWMTSEVRIMGVAEDFLLSRFSGHPIPSFMDTHQSEPFRMQSAWWRNSAKQSLEHYRSYPFWAGKDHGKAAVNCRRWPPSDAGVDNNL